MGWFVIWQGDLMQQFTEKLLVFRVYGAFLLGSSKYLK